MKETSVKQLFTGSFDKKNGQKQRFCQQKMADLKAWSHGVRKANEVLHLPSVGGKFTTSVVLSSPVTPLKRIARNTRVYFLPDCRE